jgi:cell division transport system permease protein
MRLNFVFTEVAAGLRRNLTMTIAMIMTTAISLAFFGAGLLVANQIGDMKELYFDKLEVSVYLQDTVTSAQREAIDSQLKASPEIASYKYLDKDAAFARFKQLFKGNPQLVSQATKDDLPATYLIKMKDPERYTVLAQQFPAGKNGVEEVQGQSEVLDRIFSLFNGVRNAAIALALLQALAALLLISNTIQVSAFTRRTEVGIMRLVGATRWYTQVPFLIEAVITGVIGAVLATGGLVLGKLFFIDRLLGGRLISNAIPAVGMSDVLLFVAPLLVVVGAAIATATGYVTLRLYVRN